MYRRIEDRNNTIWSQDGRSGKKNGKFEKKHSTITGKESLSLRKYHRWHQGELQRQALKDVQC